ncbi:transporter substrate-binding domain-containing protein [Desulfobacterales bacterium HSG2]|nr:transporter substrate-binding domain-containing protein [Desulfobacterales bacterium HSG2]
MRNLKEGEIDLIVGMTRTEEREKIFQYASTPMLRPEMTFAKLISDNSEYADKASLKGKTICSLDGSNSAKNISGIDGIAGMNNAYDIPTCLKILAAGRIDVVYFHHFALLYYLKEMKLGDRIRLVEKPLKTKVYYMCFSKKVNPDTVAEIDKAAADMIRDGIMKSILDRYR